MILLFSPLDFSNFSVCKNQLRTSLKCRGPVILQSGLAGHDICILKQHPRISIAMKGNSKDSQTRTNTLVINLWGKIEDLN